MPMRNIQISFPSEVLDAISATYQNNADVIKEAAVLELYREGTISSGKAAEILDMERFEFVRYAGMKGIPYIRMTPDELESEVKVLEKLQ